MSPQDPPPPPAANTNSQTSPGSTQIQQGMAYTNDPPREANNSSQRSQTISAEGLSYTRKQKQQATKWVKGKQMEEVLTIKNKERRFGFRTNIGF
ncbi:hypothetical protein P8452_16877 [Trifolium repens]|nr:hypothetical protein P8452_16877 [Trifolium repens]